MSFGGYPGQIELRKRPAGALQMNHLQPVARHAGRRDNLLHPFGLYEPKAFFELSGHRRFQIPKHRFLMEAFWRVEILLSELRPASGSGPEKWPRDSRR